MLKLTFISITVANSYFCVYHFYSGRNERISYFVLRSERFENLHIRSLEFHRKFSKIGIRKLSAIVHILVAGFKWFFYLYDSIQT